VDQFVRRYNCRGFGPRLYFRYDIPETELEAIKPRSKLPDGPIALYDGRGRNKPRCGYPSSVSSWAPTHLRHPKARSASERHLAHRERALPALRALLDLPFEQVIISHGEP